MVYLIKVEVAHLIKFRKIKTWYSSWDQDLLETMFTTFKITVDRTLETLSGIPQRFKDLNHIRARFTVKYQGLKYMDCNCFTQLPCLHSYQLTLTQNLDSIVQSGTKKTFWVWTIWSFWSLYKLNQWI